MRLVENSALGKVFKYAGKLEGLVQGPEGPEDPEGGGPEAGLRTLEALLRHQLEGAFPDLQATLDEVSRLLVDVPPQFDARSVAVVLQVADTVLRAYRPTPGRTRCHALDTLCQLMPETHPLGRVAREVRSATANVLSADPNRSGPRQSGPRQSGGGVLRSGGGRDRVSKPLVDEFVQGLLRHDDRPRDLVGQVLRLRFDTVSKGVVALQRNRAGFTHDRAYGRAEPVYAKDGRLKHLQFTPQGTSAPQRLRVNTWPYRSPMEVDVRHQVGEGWTVRPHSRGMRVVQGGEAVSEQHVAQMIPLAWEAQDVRRLPWTHMRVTYPRGLYARLRRQSSDLVSLQPPSTKTLHVEATSGRALAGWWARFRSGLGTFSLVMETEWPDERVRALQDRAVVRGGNALQRGDGVVEVFHFVSTSERVNVVTESGTVALSSPQGVSPAVRQLGETGVPERSPQLRSTRVVPLLREGDSVVWDPVEGALRVSPREGGGDVSRRVVWRTQDRPFEPTEVVRVDKAPAGGRRLAGGKRPAVVRLADGCELEMPGSVRMELSDGTALLLHQPLLTFRMQAVDFSAPPVRATPADVRGQRVEYADGKHFMCLRPDAERGEVPVWFSNQNKDSQPVAFDNGDLDTYHLYTARLFDASDTEVLEHTAALTFEQRLSLVQKTTELHGVSARIVAEGARYGMMDLTLRLADGTQRVLQLYNDDDELVSVLVQKDKETRQEAHAGLMRPAYVFACWTMLSYAVTGLAYGLDAKKGLKRWGTGQWGGLLLILFLTEFTDELMDEMGVPQQYHPNLLLTLVDMVPMRGWIGESIGGKDTAKGFSAFGMVAGALLGTMLHDVHEGDTSRRIKALNDVQALESGTWSTKDGFAYQYNNQTVYIQFTMGEQGWMWMFTNESGNQVGQFNEPVSKDLDNDTTYSALTIQRKNEQIESVNVKKDHITALLEKAQASRQGLLDLKVIDEKELYNTTTHNYHALTESLGGVYAAKLKKIDADVKGGYKAVLNTIPRVTSVWKPLALMLDAGQVTIQSIQEWVDVKGSQSTKAIKQELEDAMRAPISLPGRVDEQRDTPNQQDPTAATPTTTGFGTSLMEKAVKFDPHGVGSAQLILRVVLFALWSAWTGRTMLSQEEQLAIKRAELARLRGIQ